MNMSEAMTFASKNVTELVAPYRALGPYYLTYISSPYIIVKLEPMYYNGVPLLATWYRIFPYADWQYYPEAVSYYVGGNVQALTAFLAGKAN